MDKLQGAFEAERRELQHHEEAGKPEQPYVRQATRPD